MNTLGKVEVVLPLDRRRHSVSFSPPIGEGSFGVHVVVSMSLQEWEDMGSPETITVTVVPGDTLNA